MTKQINFVLSVGITCMLASCSSKININYYIDKNSSFILSLNSTDKMTGLTKATQTVIIVNSSKYSKLLEWFSNNESGWQLTPASYVADISVRQGSFRLLYTKGTDSAVINFVDKENKSRQYSKSITKGELDFLSQMNE